MDHPPGWDVLMHQRLYKLCEHVSKKWWMHIPNRLFVDSLQKPTQKNHQLLYTPQNIYSQIKDSSSQFLDESTKQNTHSLFVTRWLFIIPCALISYCSLDLSLSTHLNFYENFSLLVIVLLLIGVVFLLYQFPILCCMFWSNLMLLFRVNNSTSVYLLWCSHHDSVSNWQWSQVKRKGTL